MSFKLNKICLITLLATLSACGEHSKVTTSINAVIAERQSTLSALPQITGVEVPSFSITGPETVFADSQNAELVNWLPIPHRIDKQFTVYSVELKDIEAGDVLDFRAYGEVTNDTGLNVMIAQFTCLATGPSREDCFEELTESRGTNVTPGMHHHAFSEPGKVYRFTDSYESVFINVVIYSASSMCDGSQKLKVEHDYGELTGSVRRYQ